MNKVAAIAIIGVVALAFIAGITVSASASTTSMTMIFYDSSGNKVYETSTAPKFIGFGFANKEGAAIASVKVVVTYVVTGVPSTETLVIDCDDTIIARLNTITAGIVKTTTGGWTDYAAPATNTHSTTWQLTDLISPVDASGKTNGWSLEFTSVITATTTIDGESRTCSVILTGTVAIKWAETTFSIAGTIGFA